MLSGMLKCKRLMILLWKIKPENGQIDVPSNTVSVLLGTLVLMTNMASVWQ